MTRNRVKRWLRESLRHERGVLDGRWDVVFIAHPSAATAGYATLRAEVRGALEQIGSSDERGRGGRRAH